MSITRTELSLGVIAPNLALSRSIYHQFIKRDSGAAKAKGSHQHKYSYGSRSRSAYSKRQSARTHPTQGKRSSSAARSEDSEIPLRPVIEKTVEVHIYSVDGKP